MIVLIYGERIVRREPEADRGDFSMMFVWNHVVVLAVHNYKNNISAALLWWNTNEYTQPCSLGVRMAAATNVCYSGAFYIRFHPNSL